jgi:ParB family chromosome partitioning protein
MASKLDEVKTRSLEAVWEKKETDKNLKGKKVTEPLYTSIPMGLIVFKTNIRSEFFDEDINELAVSMKTFGQLQPCQVYEENDEYVIIYGHRRYLAAKEAGINELNCIIIDKPSDIDTIYMQVIENEQVKSLSAKDREAYIKKLRDMGESFEVIAQKVGKSVPWIRQCAIAAEVREKNQPVLDKANIEFGTTDIYNFRNATKDEVEEAIKLSCVNPEQKNAFLSDINRRKKKKYNVGGKRKNTTSEMEPGSLNNQGTIKHSISDNSLISFRIILDEKEKSFSIVKVSIADLTDSQVNSVLAPLCQIYEEKGYNQISKV